MSNLRTLVYCSVCGDDVLEWIGPEEPIDGIRITEANVRHLDGSEAFSGDVVACRCTRDYYVGDEPRQYLIRVIEEINSSDH